MIKVAITGPESTGKSTLAKQLAYHYNGIWISEYAREFLKGKENLTYDLKDVEQIAHTQISIWNEVETLQNSPQLGFYDGDLFVIKIWCEEVFEKCPKWISEEILNNKFDIHLLLKPDLPWENDPLRENQHNRDYLFDRYKSELENSKKVFRVIEGEGRSRLENSIVILSEFLNKG